MSDASNHLRDWMAPLREKRVCNLEQKLPGNHTWFAFPLKTVHVQLVVTQAYENVA